MALDPHIILSGKLPQFDSPLDVAAKASTLKQLALQGRAQEKQLAETEAMQEILKKNTVTGSDGRTSINKGAVLSDLYKANPQKAMDLQKVFDEQDIASLEKDTKLAKHAAFNQLLPDGSNWKQVKAGLISQGVRNADQLPEIYSPSFHQKWQVALLNGEEQLKHKLDQQKFELDKRKTTAEIGKTTAETAKINKELSQGKNGGLTEGFKAADKDYAKDYNDFTGGGQAKAVDAINKLKDYKKMLESEAQKSIQAGGGPISGSMPDAFRTQESIALRDNIITTANSGLKSTFGGQLSDGERKSASNEFYNDKLDAAKNIDIIDRKIKELENGLNVQTAKAEYFRQNGTLQGFGEAKSSKPGWAK